MLANLLFVDELQRRLSAAGASTIAVSAHPGAARTEISRNLRWVQRTLSPLADVLQQSAAMGALPVLRAAVDPTVTARMGAASSEMIAAHAIDATLETFESLYARALGLPSVRPTALAA